MRILNSGPATLAPDIARLLGMPADAPGEKPLEETEHHPNTSNNALAEAAAKWACEYFAEAIEQKRVTKRDVAMFAANCASVLGGDLYSWDHPDSCMCFISRTEEYHDGTLLGAYASMNYEPDYADLVFPLGAAENYTQKEKENHEQWSERFWGYDNISPPEYELDSIHNELPQKPKDFLTLFYGEIRKRIENDKWQEVNSKYFPVDLSALGNDKWGHKAKDFGEQVALQTCRDLLLSAEKANKPEAYRYRPPSESPPPDAAL